MAAVEARLGAIRPVLMCQELVARATGVSCHAPAGLAGPGEILRCNVAKHAGFGMDAARFSGLSVQELRALQRGSSGSGTADTGSGSSSTGDSLHKMACVFGPRTS